MDFFDGLDHKLRFESVFFYFEDGINLYCNFCNIKINLGKAHSNILLLKIIFYAPTNRKF